MEERTKKPIEEMSFEEIKKLDEKYVLHGLTPTPVCFTDGKGAVVKDINGKEHLDFISQTSGPMVLGHKHPKYVEALKKRADKLIHTQASTVSIEKVELSEKLAELAPGKMKNNCMTYFSCGGGEAVETALRFAMTKTGKHEVISVYDGYHGRTLALVSLIGQSWRRWGNIPTFPGFHQIPNSYCYRCYFGKTYPNCNFECARMLEHQIKHGAAKDQVVAFIIEPITGNGGHQLPPSNEYWKIIREICDKYNILLIVDEIQTGFGRTGTFWASEQFGIEPDILVSGKALGGGVPLSATMIRSDLVTDYYKKHEWQCITMGGGPLLTGMAKTTIDIIEEENLVENAKKMGNLMMKRLKQMQQKHPLIGEVRGKGVFLGVELVKDRETKEAAIVEAEQVVAKALEKGLFIALNYMAGYGNVVKFKPPIVINEQQVNQALDILEEALSEVEQQKFQ